MPHDLNPAQRKAVSTLSGPLLVLAGAGTGKTRVVTYRIAELIRHGTRPDRILAVTFTNKAAAEMQQRVAELLGRKVKARPEVSTFHSLCVRILRRHIRKLGYPENFAIYDWGDQESVARSVLRELQVPNVALRPSDMLAIIGRWKNSSVRPQQAVSLATTDREHFAAAGYRRYQQALKNAGAVDFDDLLLCTEDLFGQFPTARAAEAERFDHLLIDEYQDTNGSQYRIVRALAQRHGNLCVVGDDDQSIYGWRGAEVEHILRFTRDWPRATVVRLEQNYRSTTEILELANRLIAFNKQRHAKVLRAARSSGVRPRIEQHKDEAEEAKWVVGDIQRQLQRPPAQPRDFAILFRTNEQPRALEAELRWAGIPYVLIGGLSFFDRKEVRDILAYLKVLDAPRDEVALLRILNTPPRGLSPKAIETIVARAVEQGKTAWDVLCEPSLPAGLSDSALAGARRFVALIQEYRRQLGTTSLAQLARSLIQTIDYESELRRVYHDPNDQQSRWDAVQEIVNALASHEKQQRRATLQGFLDDLLLDSRDFDREKESQLRANAIALMTLHSAKGLEFAHVYLVGLEEGILPHHRSLAADEAAIEEERRLCYVGVSRARDRLTLSLSLTRMKWGKPKDSCPSRFLYEMTGMAEQPARRTPGKKKAGGHRRAPHRGSFRP